MERVRLLESIREKLRRLYGDDRTPDILSQIQRLIDSYPPGAAQEFAFSERNVLIIAYGDHLQRDGEPPLATLGEALGRLRLPVSGLHLLPFYPYSSDDGFSVIDYKAVDPALGSWADVHALCRRYDVMFDGVFNHLSAKSGWFQAFLRGEAPYSDFFITVDPTTDLSRVTRPRTLPLLTRFETANGSAHVWTTFSSDQIDLNYANPAIAVLDALLYVARAQS
ncbi:MAG: alpha-amylase family glycosyl hydrolase [Anaerolineae bacterium]